MPRLHRLPLLQRQDAARPENGSTLDIDPRAAQLLGLPQFLFRFFKLVQARVRSALKGKNFNGGTSVIEGIGLGPQKPQGIGKHPSQQQSFGFEDSELSGPRRTGRLEPLETVFRLLLSTNEITAPESLLGVLIRSLRR